jgi:hypothetical protein
MKINLAAVAAFLLLSPIVFSTTSCKKEDDAGLLPLISLKTGTGYISKDSTVAKSFAFKIGATATQAEANDVLTKMVVSVSYDNGADSVLTTDTLTGTQGASFSKDFNGITRNKAGIEQYTFKVINKDGLINSAIVKLTVQ